MRWVPRRRRSGPANTRTKSRRWLHWLVARSLSGRITLALNRSRAWSHLALTWRIALRWVWTAHWPLAGRVTLHRVRTTHRSLAGRVALHRVWATHRSLAWRVTLHRVWTTHRSLAGRVALHRVRTTHWSLAWRVALASRLVSENRVRPRHRGRIRNRCRRTLQRFDRNGCTVPARRSARSLWRCPLYRCTMWRCTRCRCCSVRRTTRTGNPRLGLLAQLLEKLGLATRSTHHGSVVLGLTLDLGLLGPAKNTVDCGVWQLVLAANAVLQRSYSRSLRPSPRS